MSEKKTIGVLTSGGDAPGMNAAIRAVVRAAIRENMNVVGIMHGYNGLLNGEFKDLNERSVSDIIGKGGTILYTARCLEFKKAEGVDKAVEKCKEKGLTGGIVVIGGDGSFRGARDLSVKGIPCIGIPGTIDNDINCTEYTIGYDTALNTAVELVDKIRDTAQSHDRCSVVEVMGRGAGYIAVNVGAACGAVEVITNEMPYSIDSVVEKIQALQKTGKKHFIVVVSEGVGGSVQMAEQIEDRTDIETRATILGHVQRGGAPSVRDRVIASKMGKHAVKLLSQGIGNRVVSLKQDQVVDYDILEGLDMKKPYEVELHKLCEELSF
ncbi:MAG: 6-phosphofructokinase [Oscillospiraceae bacterium]|jgi:6-phosphofructokinase 1|nr:6-phosphofructokinase [Oscillospiraceae bacterium]